MKTISGCFAPSRRHLDSGGQKWTNELNLFLDRLSSAPTWQATASRDSTTPHPSVSLTELLIVNTYDNTHALCKKSQSRLQLLRRLGPFGGCRVLLWTCYGIVVTSALFYAVACWGGGITEGDKGRLKLIGKASSVLGCHRASIVEVGEKMTKAKLSTTPPPIPSMRQWGPWAAPPVAG